MAPLLQVKDLKTYFFTEDGVVKAVDGISYDVQTGEIVGLVGESGCGKTVSALSILKPIPDPPGCVFHTHCPIASDAHGCRAVVPDWRNVGASAKEHWVACHRV
jgi:ABC-type dipeptide/oligopeptide/nickel transport system ATPase component